MAKTKISEYSATPADNTDISNINIAEGCSPANVNNAIRSLMSQIKDLQAGTSGDTIPIAAGGTGSTTATAARTALSAAKSGANSDITSITGLTTPLTIAQGGTGTASTTFTNLTTNVTGTLPVTNGGTGLATLTANNVILGNGTSTPSFVAPSTSGNVLSSNGTTWQSASLDKLTSGTAQTTTSGTSKTFSSIPSWVKRITIIFNEVSGNGSSNLQVQVGAGSTATTGYVSTGINISSSGAASSSTSAFYIRADDSTYISSGTMTLVNVSGNTWISNHLMKTSTSQLAFGGGSVAIGGTLDRVVISFANGTDAFDAGSVNILYE